MTVPMMTADATISNGESGNVGVTSGVGVASAGSVALTVAYSKFRLSYGETARSSMELMWGLP